MKIKPQKVKMSIDGEKSEHGKLTKKAPRIVWYTEHSAVTEELSRGKTKEAAETEYLERAARTMLEAALQVLDEIAARDQGAADGIAGAFFLQTRSAPVTYEDGEPVELEDYEEQ